MFNSPNSSQNLFTFLCPHFMSPSLSLSQSNSQNIKMKIKTNTNPIRQKNSETKQNEIKAYKQNTIEFVLC